MSETPEATKTPPNTSADAHRRATVRLRAAHPDEYAGYLVEEYQRRGLAYKPRRTPEEREAAANADKLRKARETVAKLLDEFGTDVIPE